MCSLGTVPQLRARQVCPHLDMRVGSLRRATGGLAELLCLPDPEGQDWVCAAVLGEPGSFRLTGPRVPVGSDAAATWVAHARGAHLALRSRVDEAWSAPVS